MKEIMSDSNTCDGHRALRWPEVRNALTKPVSYVMEWTFAVVFGLFGKVAPNICVKGNDSIDQTLYLNTWHWSLVCGCQKEPPEDQFLEMIRKWGVRGVFLHRNCPSFNLPKPLYSSLSTAQSLLCCYISCSTSCCGYHLREESIFFFFLESWDLRKETFKQKAWCFLFKSLYACQKEVHSVLIEVRNVSYNTHSVRFIGNKVRK